MFIVLQRLLLIIYLSTNKVESVENKSDLVQVQSGSQPELFRSRIYLEDKVPKR